MNLWGNPMLKVLATVIVVLVAGVLAYAATQPDVFRVRRSANIKAPLEKIFPYINDLNRFSTWSPYEKKDPGMKKSYRGPTAGKGAVMEWDGDKNVGQGRIEIVESSPSSNVTMNLDMLRPFAAHNLVEFTLEPNGDSTRVTWAMQGKVPYLAKIVHVFVNVDKMVGTDFENGLADLKTIVEK